MDPQSGMESWQGQSAGLPSDMLEVMVHDLPIAKLAIGAKAIVSASKRASMVRCSAIGFRFLVYLYVALGYSEFK